MALKLLFINSFYACVPKSPFLDDKDQNILSGKSEYVREKMNQSDLRVTSSNRRQWRENARDYVLCVSFFVYFHKKMKCKERLLIPDYVFRKLLLYSGS